MDSHDEMLVCPYNKAHVIRKSKMPFHLKKCEKQAAVKLAHCVFNTIHVMPHAEIDAHEKICPDRGNFDQYLTVGLAVGTGQTDEFPVSNTYEENWDDVSQQVDRPVLATIRDKAKEKDIFLGVSNVPPAQRKAHRAEESRRRHELQHRKN